MPDGKKTKRDAKKGKQLRHKDPKKKTAGTRHKDGDTFTGGKNVKGRPKPGKKKNLKCFNRGGYVTCVDTGRAKNSKSTGTKAKKKKKHHCK